MHKDSTPAEILRAFIHALVMAKLVDECKEAHLESQRWMDKHCEDLVPKVSISEDIFWIMLISHTYIVICLWVWSCFSSMLLNIHFVPILAAWIFGMENRTASFAFCHLESQLAARIIKFKNWLSADGMDLQLLWVLEQKLLGREEKRQFWDIFAAFEWWMIGHFADLRILSTNTFTNSRVLQEHQVLQNSWKRNVKLCIAGRIITCL